MFFNRRQCRVNIDLSLSFLSTLLPPTPETTQHVLTQGGFTSQATYPQLDFEDSASSSQVSQILNSSPPLGASNPHQYPHTQDAPFLALLEETRSILSSSDFAYVLEVCLDRATDILFTGLERSVFVSSEPPAVSGEDVRIRLAGLLPGLARWSHLALRGLPNELVDVSVFVPILCDVSWKTETKNYRIC